MHACMHAHTHTHPHTHTHAPTHTPTHTHTHTHTHTQHTHGYSVKCVSQKLAMTHYCYLTNVLSNKSLIEISIVSQ